MYTVVANPTKCTRALRTCLHAHTSMYNLGWPGSFICTIYDRNLFIFLPKSPCIHCEYIWFRPTLGDDDVHLTICQKNSILLHTHIQPAPDTPPISRLWHERRTANYLPKTKFILLHTHIQPASDTPPISRLWHERRTANYLPRTKFLLLHTHIQPASDTPPISRLWHESTDDVEGHTLPAGCRKKQRRTILAP
jgi:hypothetical protein